MSMIIQHGLYRPANAATQAVSAVRKPEQAPQATTGKTAVSSENKLSAKAKDFLSKLRQERSDFDFVIADAGDDYQALVKQSDKEFTVIYSTADIERMANDPDFAAEKNQQIETTLSMTKKICEQYGYVSVFGKNISSDKAINGIGTVSDDKNSLLLAYLEKFAEKQRELSAGEKTVITASSPYELYKKIKSFDEGKNDNDAKNAAAGFWAHHDMLCAQQTAETLSRINDGRQTAIEIYRRMSSGAIVSPSDEESLMKYDTTMYQTAKIAQQMAKEHEDKSDEELMTEFEKRHENDRKDWTSELDEHIQKINESTPATAENESASKLDIQV